MRIFLTILLVGLLMVIAGWLTWSSNGERSTIQFNKQEAERDTRKAIQEGDEVLDETDRRLDDLDEHRGVHDDDRRGIPVVPAPDLEREREFNGERPLVPTPEL